MDKWLSTRSLCDELVLSGCGRVPERHDRQPSRHEPLRRAAVDPRRRLGIRRGEPSLRVFGEQGVHAKPLSPLQPRDEQVRALELGQHRRRVGSAEHRVTELRAELTENRRTLEEGSAVVLERCENLAAQVVGHETLVAAEGAHGARRVVDGPSARARRARAPPASPPSARRAGRSRQGPAGCRRARQAAVRFGGREGELPRAHFDELPAGAQPVQSRARDPRAS